METLYIPNEQDVKRWVKEAMQECLQDAVPQKGGTGEKENDLIDRKEVARMLQVSLVTLTDWMKRGLPFHKQRGRVYFIKSEVLEHIQKSNPSNVRELLKDNLLRE